MTYVQGLVLGLVQGVTEFLPISSSGHLILLPVLLGWRDQGLAFDAVMHLGTIGALIAYFRGELRRMASSLIPVSTKTDNSRSPGSATTMGGLGRDQADSAMRRLALLVLAATIPAGLAGLLFEKLVEQHLRLPVVVAASTIVWALVMAGADRLASRRPALTQSEQSIRWWQALGVGVAQAVALVPGTSRSGITITAGLLGGLDRPTAARFAFLLGLPITAAAGALKAVQLVKHGIPPSESGPLVAGLLAAFVAGWASIWFLVNYLKRGSLLPFVAYRLALGVLLLMILPQ